MEISYNKSKLMHVGSFNYGETFKYNDSVFLVCSPIENVPKDTTLAVDLATGEMGYWENTLLVEKFDAEVVER